MKYFNFITLNSSIVDKCLDLSEVKTFSDIKLNVAEINEFVQEIVENYTGRLLKWAGDQHFLSFSYSIFITSKTNKIILTFKVLITPN